MEIIAFGADSIEKLSAAIEAFMATVSNDIAFSSFAVAAADTRKHFSSKSPFRLLFVVETSPFDTERISSQLTSALNQLRKNNRGDRWHSPGVSFGSGAVDGSLAVLFPGQGSQYVGMGKEVVAMFPDALCVLETADKHYSRIYPDNKRLSDIIYPFDTDTSLRESQETVLRSTDAAQPAIGAVSLAMWRILASFGVRADAFCGHSFGRTDGTLCRRPVMTRMIFIPWPFIGDFVWPPPEAIPMSTTAPCWPFWDAWTNWPRD